MVIIVLAFIADFISASQARLTGTWHAKFDGTYPIPLRSRCSARS
jgi:hypothetical protein